MNKLSLLLICASFLLILACGSSSSSHSQQLTVKTSIQTSDSAENPSAVDPTNAIILEFSEPLDMNTVEGKISLHTVKAGGLLVSAYPPIEIISNSQEPNQIVIKTKDGANFLSGEEYKLVVSMDIQSVYGKTLKQDFVRYFATDYRLDYGVDNIPELGNDRLMIIIISDIHMGDLRSITDGYGWFIKNREKLVNFLNLVRHMPNVRELAIAGDLFDEWVAPMDSDSFNGVSQSEFLDMIVAAHKPVADAINNIIRDGNIRVTYIPGNHDMLVESEDVQRNFPGIFEARDNVKGLGAYTPLDHPEIIIEHGHRYDFFNAPDPISNRSITETDSIIPPGFFVSKIATTSDLESGKSAFYRQQLTDLAGDQYQSYYLSYWAAWKLIMAEKPVKESWDDKIIKTGIDGYTETYAINDLIPYYQENNGPLDVNLYKGIEDTWYDRQSKNIVSVPISVDTAIAAGAINPILDAQSEVQYFLNITSDKRIVIFGHTHHADMFSTLNHQLRWSIYANTGTWVDNGNPSCTFVTIIPKKDNDAVTDTVTLYQYIDDLDIIKLNSTVTAD
jgi:UDP-2,3-diacylglucosamine pyrophosphatase LpxH